MKQLIFLTTFIILITAHTTWGAESDEELFKEEAKYETKYVEISSIDARLSINSYGNASVITSTRGADNVKKQR